MSVIGPCQRSKSAREAHFGNIILLTNVHVPGHVHKEEMTIEENIRDLLDYIKWILQKSMQYMYAVIAVKGCDVSCSSWA